jgi:hypothetical protein
MPLRMQSNYQPDGWLGLIIGARLYVDFSHKPFGDAMAGLKQQLNHMQVTPTGSALPQSSLTLMNRNASALVTSPSPSILNKLGEPKYIDLDYEPFRVLELNDGNILVGSFDDKILGLHDSNFKLIRKISEIWHDSTPWLIYDNIQHTGLDNSANGDVYIKVNKCVNKLNKDFVVVKSSPQRDTHIRDIHVHKDRLYACYDNSRTVDVFNLDLELVSTHVLDFTPIQIRVMEAKACVNVADANGVSKTAFYKLPSFELISEFTKFGPILAHRGIFYVYHNNAGFTAFDKNGAVIDTKQTNYVGRLKYWNVGMSIVQNKLMICMKKQICKIQIN